MEYNNKKVYYFTIELYFENDNIIKNAIKLLKKEMKELEQLEIILEKKDEKIKLKIKGGKYEVLNIISSYIRKEKKLYSVYNKEHPLRDEIILEYKLNEKNEDYKKYIKELIIEINKYISKIIIS